MNVTCSRGHCLEVRDGADSQAGRDAVQDYGLDAPGVEKRQLEGKLWELKPDQQRLMYVMVAGPTMVVLHGSKKEGRKTTKADLDVARKRIKHVLEEESHAKQSKKK